MYIGCSLYTHIYTSVSLLHYFRACDNAGTVYKTAEIPQKVNATFLLNILNNAESLHFNSKKKLN